MQHILKNTIVLFLILMSTTFYGQSSTSDFTFTSERFSVSDQNIAVPSTITKTDNTLVWKPGDYAASEALTGIIDTVSGDWDENTSSGSITYHLTMAGMAYDFKMFSQENGLSASMTLIISDVNQETYLFHTNTILYL